MNRDTKREEKEEYLVNGTIYAKQFRYLDGKDVGTSRDKEVVGGTYVVVNDGEAGTPQEGKRVVDLDQDVVDFVFPKEINLADIEHDVGETNTVITVLPGTIDTEHSYHVYLEIEGTGTHYGADFTVFAYNGATCITTFNILPPNAEEPLVGFASFDSQGSLNIDIPVVMTPESEDTSIYVKRVI